MSEPANSSGVFVAFVMILAILVMLGHYGGKAKNRIDDLEHRIKMLELKTK